MDLVLCLAGSTSDLTIGVIDIIDSWHGRLFFTRSEHVFQNVPTHEHNDSVSCVYKTVLLNEILSLGMLVHYVSVLFKIIIIQETMYVK